MAHKLCHHPYQKNDYEIKKLGGYLLMQSDVEPEALRTHAVGPDFYQHAARLLAIVPSSYGCAIRLYERIHETYT